MSIGATVAALFKRVFGPRALPAPPRSMFDVMPRTADEATQSETQVITDSTAIAKLEYQANPGRPGYGDVLVWFEGGRGRPPYRYPDVPQDVYVEVVTAGSKGTEFHRRLKQYSVSVK